MPHRQSTGAGGLVLPVRWIQSPGFALRLEGNGGESLFSTGEKVVQRLNSSVTTRRRTCASWRGRLDSDSASADDSDPLRG